MNYIYMLKCSDNSIYTGWTNNLEKRFLAHMSGKASKYTRARLPVEIVYHEEHEDKISAMKREAKIKKMTRVKKLELIESIKYDTQI